MKPTAHSAANSQDAKATPCAGPSLAELKTGDSAVVLSIDSDAPAARRLLDLGLLPGTPVRAIRRAPLGDPAVYELRGARLCLRREDARHVRLEAVRRVGDPS